MCKAARVATRSTGLSVALLIVGVNRTASRRQISTNVFVTTAVFRKAVNEDHNALGLLRNPGPAKQQMTRQPSVVSFRSTDSGLFQIECALQETGWISQRDQEDSDALRISARASCTRSR